MPYYLYDANGYLAPGPTVPEWQEARVLVTGEQGLALVSTGFITDPAGLAIELRTALDLLDSDDDAAPVLQRLLAAAEQADSVLILTDGVTRA